MQRESMGGDGITGTASEAANKAFSQAMSSYTGMATTSMPYSGASSAGALHHPHTPTSQSQSSDQLAYQHQQQQLMNSAAAVMNAGAITCLVCYNAQVNIMLEPCRHQFHVHCIDRWLNKDKVCPICWIPIQSHRPIVSPYANPAVSTPGGSGSSPTSGGGGYGNGSAPNGNGTATGSGSGSHGGGMLSQPAATSILPAQAAANMEHPNPPSMRKGKWTAEESSYCDRLIEEFKKGNLPLAEGTTLRTFLSKLLNCDPMRISKKYTGDQCIGKIIFRRREDELTKDEMESIRRDLAELEKTYLEREQYNQRRREKRLESELSRDKNRFMAAARSGNGNGNINVAVAAGGANANANGMAAFNAAAVAVAANAMRPPPPPQSMGGQQGYPPPGPSPSGQQQAPSPHHHHQQQQQQQHQQQQQAYQNQLAAQQQRQQMIAAVQAQAAQAQAQAQAQAHRSAQQQAQSLAPPPRHPPAQHAYNGPPSRLKDEFPSEPPASSAMADASTSSNAQSMSRVSSIDSFGCLFPRVASVDGFGSATNLASYGASSSISSMSTTTATSDAIVDHTGGLVKSISIGDGLSAYFPRIQSLEHLSSLLQEHAPTSPTRGGTGAAANGQLPRQLNITVKSESQPSHRNEEDGEGEGGDDDHEQLPPREGVEQLRDADVSKRLSPVHQPGHLHKHSTLADYANQIQAPKPLTNKMPRSSSGIFPRVASMDKLPRVPSMDKLPRIPSMDKLSAGMDGTIPRAPSMGKLPRVPSLDKHLSRVSSNSDMMSRFGSSDHLSSFPSFSNLTGLSSSMSYDKLSSLGGGVGSAVGGGGGPHGGTFRGGSFPRNSSIEDILSLVASSESGGLSSNNSSLQLSALAALAGEESAANDRKRRLEQAHSHAGHATTSTASSASSDGAESSKKSRVSA